jgi:hypothetical protein
VEGGFLPHLSSTESAPLVLLGAALGLLRPKQEIAEKEAIVDFL